MPNRDLERRNEPRMHLGLPVRVQGHNADGTPWEEMTTTEDAYMGGVSFVLKHPVSFGNALHLDLPLPKTFRRYDLSAASYSVYALVRNTIPVIGGRQRVGAMLLGRNPPKGYAANKGGRFFLPTDVVKTKAPERRQSRRFDVGVLLKVRRIKDGGQEEQTITRNLGVGGALVLTSLPVSKSETVMVEAADGSFRTRAEVENITIGADNIPCLNLRFLDDDVVAGVKRVLRENGFSD